MNEKITLIQSQIEQMKKNLPTSAASDEQIKNYFGTQENILESFLQVIADEKSATTSEIEAAKEAIKDLRNAIRKAESGMEHLTLRDLDYQLGKGLVAAWNNDRATLGALKFCPNLRTEKWNNPKDFTWQADKGFVPRKDILGEPLGDLTTNDQYLLNPIYEDTIMQEAAKKSVMMNLVTHRPMFGASMFLNERDRGGITLKWLTQYGQKIDPTKSNVPTRVELKAYTLAGYVPFYDEFEEDAYYDLGRMFREDFMEAYGQEFDRQCLTADEDPFTGALAQSDAKVYTISSTDHTGLSYIDFRNAELKISAEERKDCCWFFNETILNEIVNIQDDNGNPIWRKPGDGLPGRIDGYPYYESSILPQISELEADKPFAVFMNPKKIVHGNRKGIEIKRFSDTTESLEYGEVFMRFRKRDGFLFTRAKANCVIMKTKQATRSAHIS